jgi:hypothetical protein
VVTADVAREGVNELEEAAAQLGAHQQVTIHVEAIPTRLSRAGLEAESHTPGAGVEGLEAAVRAVYTNTAGSYTVDADGNVLETYRAEDDGGDGTSRRSRSCAETSPRCCTTTPAPTSSTCSATESPS